MKFRLVLLKFLFSLALMGVLFYSLDVQKVRQSLGILPWYGVLILVGLLSLQLLFATVRWFYILKTYKKVRFSKVLEANVFSTFLQSVFFGFLGAFALKVVLVRRMKIPLSVAMLTLVMDRLSIFATLVLLGIGCSFFLPIKPFVDQRILLYGIGSGVLVVVVSGFVYRRFILPQQERYLRYLRTLKGFFKQMALSFLFSFLSLFFYFVGVFFLCDIMALSPSFAQILLVMPVITLVSSLPITLNGWGLRETAMIVGLGLFGVAKEDAFSLSVIIGIASILSGVPLLIFSTIVKGKNLISQKVFSDR